MWYGLIYAIIDQEQTIAHKQPVTQTGEGRACYRGDASCHTCAMMQRNIWCWAKGGWLLLGNVYLIPHLYLEPGQRSGKPPISCWNPCSVYFLVPGMAGVPIGGRPVPGIFLVKAQHRCEWCLSWQGYDIYSVIATKATKGERLFNASAPGIISTTRKAWQFVSWQCNNRTVRSIIEILSHITVLTALEKKNWHPFHFLNPQPQAESIVCRFYGRGPTNSILQQQTLTSLFNYFSLNLDGREYSSSRNHLL